MVRNFLEGSLVSNQEVVIDTLVGIKTTSKLLESAEQISSLHIRDFSSILRYSLVYESELAHTDLSMAYFNSH